jgi:excisionase family DNA binding protein
MEPLLLRVSEAAELLGISRSTCYEMLGAKQLPYIRIRERIRIPRADLIQWIGEQKQAAQAGEHGAATEEGARNGQSRIPR